jgi:hypothetical protein
LRGGEVGAGAGAADAAAPAALALGLGGALDDAVARVDGVATGATTAGAGLVAAGEPQPRAIVVSSASGSGLIPAMVPARDRQRNVGVRAPGSGVSSPR